MDACDDCSARLKVAASALCAVHAAAALHAMVSCHTCCPASHLSGSLSLLFAAPLAQGEVRGEADDAALWIRAEVSAAGECAHQRRLQLLQLCRCHKNVQAQPGVLGHSRQRYAG